MNDAGRLEIGQTFGRYQILRVLGEGGMGVVYEALHVGLKKRFAVKTLLPEIARMPEARARFLREAEAASRIRHPNVVDVIDVGIEADLPFLVMEFLEGRALSDFIADRGRMDIEEATGLLLPVLSAVAAGHAQGVVHRDLKPANIFVTRGAWGEPTAKVLDFGVSKLIGAGDVGAMTATAAVLGTAAYMSPEQAMGARGIDGRSDQFALGLILYEMLTGQRAHPGQNQFEVLHNITSGNLVPPRERRPDLPVPFEEILLRMLALAVDARYPTLLPVGRALLPYASGKLRLTLGNAFSEPVALGAAPPPTPPQMREVVGRKSTTFRASAAEIAVAAGADFRTGRRGKLIFAVATGIGVAATIFLAVNRRSPPADPAAATRSVAIPARPTDPDLPPRLGANTAAPPSPVPDPRPAPITPPPPGPARSATFNTPPTPSTRTIDVRVLPPRAEIVIDGAPPVRGHLRTTLPTDDRAVHVLRLSASGHHSKEISFGPGQDPPKTIALEPLTSPRASKHSSRVDTVRSTTSHSPETTVPAPSPLRDPVQAPKRGVNDAFIIH